MKKLIHTHNDDRGRLHCDNALCRHILTERLPWGPGLIGFPCPRCGSNMLTRQDYETSEKAMRVIAWINRWFGWLGTEEAPVKGVVTSIRNTPDGFEVQHRRL